MFKELNMDEKFERLNLRILSDDKLKLMKISKSEGETMSVIIRRLIKRELEERKKINQQKNNESY